MCVCVLVFLHCGNQGDFCNVISESEDMDAWTARIFQKEQSQSLTVLLFYWPSNVFANEQLYKSVEGGENLGVEAIYSLLLMFIN